MNLPPVCAGLSAPIERRQSAFDPTAAPSFGQAAFGEQGARRLVRTTPDSQACFLLREPAVAARPDAVLLTNMSARGVPPGAALEEIEDFSAR